MLSASTAFAQSTQGTVTCDRCFGNILRGEIELLTDVPYRIDSDLPEMFTSTGVLYTTREILPTFRAKNGEIVPLDQRRQRNLGFDSINDSFDIFLYHLSYAGEAPRERRIVAYAQNTGAHAVSLRTASMIEASGKMATADGPESRLAVRSLESAWDATKQLEIPAGEGRVIAWTPTLSDAAANEAQSDRSASDFVTGLVRTFVNRETSPYLEISVLAVPGDTAIERLSEVAQGLLETGATSAEDMDLKIAPPECHVRRVSGVSKNFLWRGANTVVDVSALPQEPMQWSDPKGNVHPGPRGVAYLMAAPRVQTVNCPKARQTNDMLLHPGYVHPETIGNYQTEYLLTFTLENPTAEVRKVDLRFGKFDADIGVAWQYAVGDRAISREELSARPAQVQWAGAWRKDDLPDDTRSFFAPAALGEPAMEAPLAILPKSKQVVSVRLVPVGTSSMPFMIFLVPDEH